MARGKVLLKRIENPVHRQVTFCKRRAGLLKKAKELSILCDAEIGVMIFSTHGKLHEFATTGSMEELIEKYKTSTRGARIGEAEAKRNLELQEEITNLKQVIQLLHKGLGCIYGQRTEDMALDELHALEEHLEIWMYQIRSAKTQIMVQEIQLLKNKEGMLTATNGYLQGKPLDGDVRYHFYLSPLDEGLKHIQHLYTACTLTVYKNQILEQTGIVEMPPTLTAELSYPLNIQNGIFQS